jgi:putative membrane protein
MKKINKLLGISLISMVLLQPNGVEALKKEETIYTNLNYDGTVIKSVVNNHLFSEESTEINDETRLKEILNLNGEEKFTLENQRLNWQNSGKDIFYQGISEEELPLDVKVTYYLDEKEVSPEDIVGKKGNIKIEIVFSNKLYNEEEGLYTPFVVNVGTILSSKNTNIEVNNGKVINTGNKNIVVAVAAPGLYDSLKLSEFKELDRVEISFDTEKFSLDNIYLIASPKLLSEADLDIFSEVDDLSSSINTIQNNMDKIEQGAVELEEGSKKLVTGSSTISDSLNLALDAVKTLNNGANVVDSSLLQVIDKLDEVELMLKDKNIEGSIASLEELRKGNDTAISTLTSTNEGLVDSYNNYGLANFKSDEEVVTYFSSLGIDSSTIEKLVTCKKTYEGNASLIYLLNQNNSAIESTISSLTSLSEEINTLIIELKSALGSIQGGTSQINNGLSDLTIGIDKIYNGSVELKDGVVSINNGTSTLASGISKLNSEGINKLTEGVNELDGYSDKVSTLVKLSNEYKGYGSDNATDTVFIYKLKSLK